MPPPARAVIFDFFGVIAYDQDPATIREIEQVLDIPAQTLWPRYWQHRRSYDLNEMGGREFWDAVAGTRLDDAVSARLVELDVASASRVDDRVVGVVRALGDRRLKVSLLSNLPLETLQWHQDNTPLLAEFDDVRASCLTSLAKPDDAAFTTAATRLNVSLAEVVFVDDQEPNVVAARRLGMHGILFQRGMDLQASLDQLLN
jgi:putative hydrolase of the HAD superfamily